MHRVKNILLPRVNKNKIAFSLSNVFSRVECHNLIKYGERKVYVQALVNQGPNLAEKQLLHIRNSGRVIIEDLYLTDMIWQRIKPSLTHALNNDIKTNENSIFNKFSVVGLNEQLRFLKYTKGQRFVTHKDGSFGRDYQGQSQLSLMTLQLYCNEDFKGGETTFVDTKDNNNNVAYQPQTGDVLIFDHNLFHRGSEVLEGIKYNIRTDIMFTKKT